MKRFYILLYVLLSHVVLMAQDEERSVNQQIWLDYNPKFAVSNTLSVYGDVGARTIFPEEWYRFNFRTGVNYTPFIFSERKPFVKYMQIHAGLGDFYTQQIEGSNYNEFRLYQGVRVYWPSRKRLRVSHYLRFEQRFEDLLNNENTEFTARTRYLLGAKISFQRPALQDFYLPLSVEFFMSLGEGLYFNDVMRLTPALGYEFSSVFRAELHASYHNGRNSPTESFRNNDFVLRLRVFHTL